MLSSFSQSLIKWQLVSENTRNHQTKDYVVMIQNKGESLN